MNKAPMEQAPILDMEPKATDLSCFLSSKSSGENSRSLPSGVMSVINSKRCGKRVTISKELTNELNNPEVLQFAFNENEIAIGEDIPENDHFFTVKVSGAKGVIYSSSLVLEITDLFNLDYSDKVSITFYQVRYVTNGGKKVAIVTVK